MIRVRDKAERFEQSPNKSVCVCECENSLNEPSPFIEVTAANEHLAETKQILQAVQLSLTTCWCETFIRQVWVHTPDTGGN